MLGKFAAVLIAAGLLLGVPVSAMAALPAPITAVPLTAVSMTMLADDVVQGVDIPKARISVTPPVEGATVQVQRWQVEKGVPAWRAAGTVRTHADGLVTVRFTLAGVGAFRWRAVGTGTGPTQVISPEQVVTVHPAVATAGDPIGPDLLALEHALCLRVSAALATLDPSAAATTPAPRGATGPPTRYRYPAASCEQRPFAAAIWAAFTDALSTCAVRAPLSTDPAAAWRPVLQTVRRQTTADAQQLGEGAASLFARVLANDQANAATDYAACLRDARRCR